MATEWPARTRSMASAWWVQSPPSGTSVWRTAGSSWESGAVRGGRGGMRSRCTNWPSPARARTVPSRSATVRRYGPAGDTTTIGCNRKSGNTSPGAGRVVCSRLEGGSRMELGLDVDDSHSPYTVLAVKGEVDVYTAPRLREKLVELVSQGKHQIVVNLEGVDFLDSTGLGELVGGLKRLRSHDGDLTLVCTQHRILKVFVVTGFPKVLSIHETVGAGVAGWGGRSAGAGAGHTSSARIRR